MTPLSTENIQDLSVEEILQALESLRVHQVELEMQNEELRKVHVELDSARERYFDLYDMAPVGYCTISENGLILEINLTAATLLGLARSALIKQPITRYILPEDQEIYYLLRKQIFDTGASQKCELRMLKMDGVAFWTHLDAIAALDADGVPVCRIVVSDITERRKSDENLRESEQNFRNLADSGQAMIWTSGKDKLCNYFNRVWLEFTGRTQEAEMGNGWAEGVHPDDLQRCLNTYVEAFDRREKFNMEYRLRRYDGEYRWILDEGCPRYDRHNEFIGYIGHCLDITARKLDEDNLSAQEMKYRRLFENILDVYFETTMAGVVQEVSPSFKAVFGFSREEVIGKSVMDIYVNSFDWDLYLERLLQQGNVRNFKTKFSNKDGAHLWVSISSTLVFQSDGTPYGIVGSIRDVTDQKQREMELRVKDYVISTSTFGIAFAKLDGIIIYVNPSFVNMWGYDAEKDMRNRSLNDFFRTDLPAANIVEYLLEIGNNGVEMMAVRKDRSIFAARISTGLVRDNTGNPLCISLSATDAGFENFSPLYGFAIAGDFTLDCDSVIQAVNFKKDVLFGISNSLLIGRRFDDFISANTLPSFLAFMNSLRTAIYPRGCCNVEIVGEGHPTLYVHIDGIGVANGEGRQIRIAVIDVSGRKPLHDMLRVQEKTSRRLLNCTREVYFETTPAGGVQEVSPSILTVTGFSREDVIGKSVFDFQVEPDRWDLFLKMLIKNEKVKNFEMKIISKDGTHRWISSTATLMHQSDGMPYKISGYIRDVTERKQRELESLIKDSVISTSAHGIALVNLDGKIMYANPSFVDMWKYDSQMDVIDLSINDHFETDEPNFIAAGFLLEKENQFGEMMAVRSDRSCFTAQVSTCLVKDTMGNPLCINVSVTDVSFRKEMEDIMIRQEKLSSLGLLAAGLAHELRNPLAVISSCAQFCIENMSLDRLVTENIQMIYRNSQRASHLISELLAFSRPSDIQPRLLNINDILLKMMEMAKLQTVPFHIVIESQLTPDLPPVSGDEEKLEQVFLNILINAVQAVSGEGREEKGKVIIRTIFHPNKDQVEVSVIDDGPGIPKEYRKRIFDPFFTTKDGGTGLGLSISYSIIQLHKGIIAAEPNPGGGTRISVMLPVIFHKTDGTPGVGVTKAPVDVFHVSKEEGIHADGSESVVA